MEVLAVALVENTTLQKLDLSVSTFPFLFLEKLTINFYFQHNKIKPKAAVELFKALTKNRALLELQLQAPLLSPNL